MAYGFPQMSFLGTPVPMPCIGHAGLGFRRARPGDAPAILAHLGALSPETLHRAYVARRLASLAVPDWALSA